MIFSLISQWITKVFGRVEKRIRTISVALLLSSGLLFASFLPFNIWWIILPILIVVTWILSYIAILEGIQDAEWFMLFFLPVMLTIAFYLFYFLFPVRWITRIPLTFIYGLSIYAALLTSNIFNIGVEKSLQLYRAAFSVNYLYQILVLFLLTNVLLSFQLNFLYNALALGIITVPFAMQMLWSVKPKVTIDPHIPYYSIAIGYLVAQTVLISSFIAIPLSMVSLVVTAVYYSLVGLIFHDLDERLFPQTVREYVTVLIIVLVITLLTIH